MPHTDSETGSQQLSAALQQDPVATPRSLEAAIRAGAAFSGHNAALDMPCMVSQAAVTLFDQQPPGGPPPPPSAAALAGQTPDTTAAAALAAQACSSADGSGGGREIFALLLTALKYVTARDTQGDAGAELFSTSMGVCNACCWAMSRVDGEPASLQHPASSGDDNTPDVTVTTRWMWLAGRALVACSTAVQVSHALCACCAGGPTLTHVGAPCALREGNTV